MTQPRDAPDGARRSTRDPSRQPAAPDTLRDVAPLDAQRMLDELAALPVSAWRYRWEPEGVRHVGPLPEQFLAAFDLGADERVINLLDANGVLVVALQALLARVAWLEGRIATLEDGQPRLTA